MSSFLWVAVITALFQQEKGKQLEGRTPKKERKEIGKKKKRRFFMFRELFSVVSIQHLSLQAKVPGRACGTAPLPKYSEQVHLPF